MSEREEKFERMLQAVQEEYADTVRKMEKLKAENKSKTVTFKHQAYAPEYFVKVQSFRLDRIVFAPKRLTSDIKICYN